MRGVVKYNMDFYIDYDGNIVDIDDIYFVEAKTKELVEIEISTICKILNKCGKRVSMTAILNEV